MTTLLAFLMAGGVLAGVALIMLFPLLLVITIVAAVLKILFFVLFLPLRAVGWGIAVAAGIFGLLLRGFVLTGVVALLLLLGLVPLLPIVLIGALVYWLVRATRRVGPAAAVRT